MDQGSKTRDDHQMAIEIRKWNQSVEGWLLHSLRMQGQQRNVGKRIQSLQALHRALQHTLAELSQKDSRN